MSNPVFSIIIPVYKVENYLDKCVQSTINQTYSNIEIILVDDGSPDRCPFLCDEYAKKDSRIKVIHKENGGLSDARNAGIRKASGEYIIFLDSDDYIELDTCERLLPFTKDNYDIIAGDGVSYGAEKRLSHSFDIPFGISGREYMKAALYHKQMPMTGCLYIYKRSFLSENNLTFKYGILHEDEQFTPRAFLKAESVANSGVRFYNYMVRDDSITTKKDYRKNAVDLYDTCMELTEIYAQLEDIKLKELLLDSLVVKYLSLFQTGRLFQYGREFIHKKFVRKNAYLTKTKLKAYLFCLSPAFYWHINNITKI